MFLPRHMWLSEFYQPHNLFLELAATYESIVLDHLSGENDRLFRAHSRLPYIAIIIQLLDMSSSLHPSNRLQHKIDRRLNVLTVLARRK
jgi:hypothetical protein